MIGDQIMIGCQPGSHTQNTSKILLLSLDSAPIRLRCHDVEYQVTPVACGADAPPVGKSAALYAGVVEVTGLASNTDYPYTAIQGSNTRSGTLGTAPKAGDDFSVIMYGCDNPGTLSLGQGEEGLLPWIRRRVLDTRQPRVASLCNVDDTNYSDQSVPNDSAGTGHFISSTPATLNTEYAYALTVAAQFGLLQDISNAFVRSGRGESRAWVFANKNRMLQVGDHEFKNDLGWTSDAKADPVYATVAGLWDKTFGLIMPPRLNSPTDYSWLFDYGDMAFLAFDRISNANSASTGGPNWGNAQIDAALAAIGGLTNMKALVPLMSNSVRSPSALGETILYGAQNPVAPNVPAEWARFMTAATTGLMARRAAMGFQFAFWHGDYHTANVLKHENAGGAVAESFLEFTAATVNCSNNQTNDASIVVGSNNNGTTMVWQRPNAHLTNQQAKGAWIAEITSYGSRSPYEWEIKIIDLQGQVCTRALYRYGVNGNLPLAAGRLRMAA